MALGGGGGALGATGPFKDKSHSDETKKKISEKTKEGIHNAEKWERFIKAQKNKDVKGEKNPMYGKHHTDETKKKISENKERGEKISKTLMGHDTSEETRKKISDSNKRKFLYLDPNGNEHIMNKAAATRFHPDWIKIKEIKES